jgi:putative nucleotidyltransferase with HDIG domain
MKKVIPKISILATLAIALIITFAALLLESLFLLLSFSLIIKILVWFIFAVFISIAITVGFIALSPGFFDAVLALKKMTRFENFSHPLLLKLAYEAPGTFHHSINVSIMGQKAAKSIGADSMLVRVSAYYHDIGKLESPTRFIENQSGEEIPTIENAEYIRTTAAKIISHIDSGLKIGAEHHLPAEILDMISEHHGTTKVLYFFEKAKERGLKIKKTDFRYSGPIPRSKESAILMLADSIEAATRAVPNLTQEIMDEIVTNTLRDKQTENQFKNSGLSDQDFETLKKSFTETLKSIYHQRITAKHEQNSDSI